MHPVVPTTAHKGHAPFYAACSTCGWLVFASRYASAGIHAGRHAAECENAATEVGEVETVVSTGGGAGEEWSK